MRQSLEKQSQLQDYSLLKSSLNCLQKISEVQVCHTSREYQDFKEEEKRVKSREEDLLLWLFYSPMLVTKGLKEEVRMGICKPSDVIN